MVDIETNLEELCGRIVNDIDNCTNSDKKDAYTYLDLKVKATNESADIKGFLDPSVLKTDPYLLITKQTSGSTFNHYKNNLLDPNSYHP